MTYNEMLKIVQHRCNQRPLIGKGVTVFDHFSGTNYKIGDRVIISDPSGKEWDGILVLILDQGICLLSDTIWMQINMGMYRHWVFRLSEENQNEFSINLV